VYLAAERKNKGEIQGSFTPFRMTISNGKEGDWLQMERKVMASRRGR
jgi:hypothetical protein